MSTSRSVSLATPRCTSSRSRIERVSEPVAAVVVEDNAGNDEDEYHHDDEQGVPTAFIGLVDHLLGSGGRERLQHHPAETRHLADAHRARAALSLVAVRDRLVIGKSALQIAGAEVAEGSACASWIRFLPT